MNKPRFRDGARQLYDFLDEILVVCPACKGSAAVRTYGPALPAGVAGGGLFQARRLVCERCSYVWEWARVGVALPVTGEQVCDPFFHLPLWLQTSCCGKTLWAYNRRHRQFLEEYIRAELREKESSPRAGYHNQGLANRLPEWMIVGKHRQAVLRALFKLQQPRR